MELPDGIESVRVMNLRPGDTLVMKCARKISMMEMEHIKRVLEERFPGHRVLVLDNDLDLDVVRKSE